MSYVIRNCPSIYENYEDKFVCTTQIKQKGFPYYCQDCTDCIMKQIVELCKEVENIENVETLYDAAQSGMFLQANRILKLLDIQEVE